MNDSRNPAVAPPAVGQTAEASPAQGLTLGVPEGKAVTGESILSAGETETLAEAASAGRVPARNAQRGELPQDLGLFHTPQGSTDSREAPAVQGFDGKTSGSASGLDSSLTDLDMGANSGNERAFSLNTGRQGFEASGGQIFQVAGAPGLDSPDHAPVSSAVSMELGEVTPEAPTRHATSEAAAIRESVLQQLEDESFQLLRTRRNEAEIQLNPPELGKIRLRLSVTDASVRGFVEVENPVVRSMLQADMSRLIQSLANQGLNLGEFDVHLLEERSRGRRGQAKQEPSGGRSGSARTERVASIDAEDNRTAGGGSVVDYWM
jgi:hypothetical protein